jgi:hypothetical protein
MTNISVFIFIIIILYDIISKYYCKKFYKNIIVKNIIVKNFIKILLYI